MDILILYFETKAIDQLHRTNPKIPQYAPNLWTVHTYEKIPQVAPDPDEINLLNKKSTKRIQYIVGPFLYYDRSDDPTMLREISEISRVQ